MSELVLYIGNKNYSSWSLRGWLALKATGQPFREVMIPLDQPETHASIRTRSPSGRVPALHHGDLVVWDSLAIGEYLAETFPAARLLPEDAKARAHARSIIAEMHSGFAPLRNHLPMNLRRTAAQRPRPPEVDANVARIQQLWGECRARFGAGGPFLFGHFTLADAAYAPVATRFATYLVPVDATSAAYMDAIIAHPAMAEWIADAKRETLVVPSDEV